MENHHKTVTKHKTKPSERDPQIKKALYINNQKKRGGGSFVVGSKCVVLLISGVCLFLVVLWFFGGLGGFNFVWFFFLGFLLLICLCFKACVFFSFFVSLRRVFFFTTLGVLSYVSIS